MALINKFMRTAVGKFPSFGFSGLLILCALGFGASCSTLAKPNDTGVIVANRAEIRSSTAVVAADLLKVNRGDPVDILDAQDVQDPTDNTKKERWLRVRAHDEDSTEGWIESRNVMPDEVLQNSPGQLKPAAQP